MNSYPVEFFFSLDHFAHKNLWKDGDRVWSALEKLKVYIDSLPLGKIEIKIPDGVYLQNRELISIGKGTIIEPGVLIQGPCVIGESVVIRHGAYVREYSLIGDRCVIGHSAETKHSILLNEAAATHFVYVGDSILGNRVNLGAGVKCANLRLDRKEISVFHEGIKIKTGLKKFGAVVGDRSQIGCNCVLNPGTLVSPGTIAYPLSNLSGFITQGSVNPKALLEQMGRLT